MTPVDIDKLKEILIRATPVPWEAQGTQREGEDRGVGIIGLRLNDDGAPMFTPTNGIVAAALPCPTEIDDDDYERVEANAALIVAAVNSLAALIAKAERVDALTEVVERAQQILSVTYQNWHLAARNALSPKESE